MTSVASLSVVLLVVRVFLGAMIFSHGYRKVFKGGKLTGTASWFESIGMRPGSLNAFMAATTELGVGALLVAGFLTTLAAAGLIAVMTVAIVTVHRFNGFFVFNKGQGIEYCLCVVVASLVPGVFGAGQYSLDYFVRNVGLWRWFEHPSHALLVTVVLGFGGAAAQLAALYRPPKVDPTS
jgi:putative oxidoreductase